MTHAVTRISSFLILAFFLATGDVSILVICCLLTVSLYLIEPLEDFSKLLRSILKMKWFFVSILLVYIFIDNVYSDFISQLLQGGKRILILVIMMLLVSWLLNKTPRDQIISAIIYFFMPLKITGFPVESMALRIELIFHNMSEVQKLIMQKKDNIDSDANNFTTLVKAVSGIYFDIVQVIDSKPLQKIVIEVQPAATIGQWSVPILLLIILFTIHNYL